MVTGQFVWAADFPFLTFPCYVPSSRRLSGGESPEVDRGEPACVVETIAGRWVWVGWTSCRSQAGWDPQSLTCTQVDLSPGLQQRVRWSTHNPWSSDVTDSAWSPEGSTNLTCLPGKKQISSSPRKPHGRAESCCSLSPRRAWLKTDGEPRDLGPSRLQAGGNRSKQLSLSLFLGT